MSRNLLLVAALLGGCSRAARPALPPHAAATLSALREVALGELVYRGRVQPRGPDADALFHYERRSLLTPDGPVSSHLTSDGAGEVLVLQRAEHTEAYALRTFDEIHVQTGAVGRVEVDGEHTATFEVTTGGRTRTRTETGRAPVHVGPTLFGYVVQHWDALTAGEVRHVRFAVVEALKTYRFALRLEARDADTTTIRMRATDPLVALAVPAMRLTFDTRTRHIRRYEGRVPPRAGPSGRERPLEARVDYEFVADGYR